MANSTAGLFETLVVAAGGAASNTKFSNSMLERIWLNPRSTYGTVGQTMKVNIPTVDTSLVTDIGSGDLAPSDAALSVATITVDTNYSSSYVIRDFEEVRTPEDMRNLFVDARMEALVRKIDIKVASLVTAGNFASYTSITGGADTFARAHLATAWQNLAGGGAPVADSPNFFFTTSHIPYSNMLVDTALVNESVVGINAAEAAQQRAVLLSQFGANLGYDQEFPLPGAGTYAGLMHHRNAIALAAVIAPLSNAPNVQETVVYPKKGLPVRVQLGYDITKQGWVVHLSCAFGVAVVRPEYGSFLVTT